ncbi:hypothetical protein C8R47DRAFT_793407 [Mycena vitilis]|nr:hypothetical protein C8R47DRAFT_793407 [Mycena vitilis]
MHALDSMLTMIVVVDPCTTRPLPSFTVLVVHAGEGSLSAAVSFNCIADRPSQNTSRGQKGAVNSSSVTPLCFIANITRCREGGAEQSDWHQLWGTPSQWNADRFERVTVREFLQLSTLAGVVQIVEERLSFSCVRSASLWGTVGRPSGSTGWESS